MKGRLILLSSVALNVGLLALAGLRLADRAELSPPSVTVQVATNKVTGPVPERVEPSARTATPRFRWGQVESEDYASYIANLRAVGCPEKTVQDIVLADVEKFYFSRIVDVERMPVGRFWQTAEKRALDDRRKQRRIRELRREKWELIQTLLGLDYDLEDVKNWHEEEWAAMLLGFLPDPRPVQVIAQAKRFGEESEGIEHEAGGILTPEDVALKRRRFDQMMMELGKRLSPFELEEAELRAVAVAMFMVDNLFGDKPPQGLPLTGPEFRELVRLKALHDHPLREEFEWPDEAGEERQREAKNAFESAAKKLLGDQRYVEYLRLRDAAFRNLCAVVDGNNLPRESALRAYEIVIGAEVETGRLRRDDALARDEREESIQEIRLSAAVALRKTLGEKALADYRNQGAPKWLGTRPSR